MILIGNKKQKNTIIVRQLSQRKEGAKKDIFDEFSQAGIKFYENHRDRDVRRHIITLHQIWRDKCMSGSESISEVYLESCSALKVNPSKEINALRQTLESLVNESDYYLKSQCGSPTLGRLEMVEPHISEADAMMRPFLFKRISQYSGQNLSCLFGDDPIATKGFVIRAEFFQTLPIG